MGVDSNGDMFITKWTWIAVIAVFALLCVAVVYGFSTHRPARIGLDYNKPLSLADSKLKLDASPYAYPPPKTAFGPWKEDKEDSTQKAAKLNRRAREQRVTKMFPMGSVIEPSPQARSQPKEDFPSFSCQGRQWHNTGRFAAGGEIELTPSSCSTDDGHTLYALAGSGDNPHTLFAQSLDDPDKYAIYR